MKVKFFCSCVFFPPMPKKILWSDIMWHILCVSSLELYAIPIHSEIFDLCSSAGPIWRDLENERHLQNEWGTSSGQSETSRAKTGCACVCVCVHSCTCTIHACLWSRSFKQWVHRSNVCIFGIVCRLRTHCHVIPDDLLSSVKHKRREFEVFQTTLDPLKIKP